MDTAQSTRSALEVVDLWKSFGFKRERVLCGVNLKVKPGSITFLLGPSGTGKSVLLKHIVGLMQPDRGEVLVFGEEIPYDQPARLNALRMNFGVLFQGVALFDTMTVFQNVAFPLQAHRGKLTKPELREQVVGVLRSVGLDPDVILEKFPNQLSGGMQKRVGLARAIILRPRIVLYDEPTTGLDPLNRTTVEDMIADAKKEFGLTNFIISHDIGAAVELADQIAFLHGGRIIFDGTAEELLRSENEVVRSFLHADKRHRRISA